MEAVFTIQGHPTTDTLEEYAFKRLSEADTEVLEEHVLVCPDCQASLVEVDDYILLMKQAAASFQIGTESPRGSERTEAVVAVAPVKKGARRSLTLALG